MGATLSVGLVLEENFKKRLKYKEELDKKEQEMDKLYDKMIKENEEKIEKIIKENKLGFVSVGDFINAKMMLNIDEEQVNEELKEKTKEIVKNTDIDYFDEFIKGLYEITYLMKKVELSACFDNIIEYSYRNIEWLGEIIKEVKKVNILRDGIVLSEKDIDDILERLKNVEVDEDEEFIFNNVIGDLNEIKRYIADSEIICVAMVR